MINKLYLCSDIPCAQYPMHACVGCSRYTKKSPQLRTVTGMRNMQQSLPPLGKNCQAAQAVSCLTSSGPGRDSPSARDSQTGA